MAVEILAFAMDGPAGSGYRKGGISQLKPDGWQWGAKETLPGFVRVTVNGVTFRNAITWAERWRRKLSVELVSSDLALDKHRVRVFSDSVRASDGFGSVILAEISDFLTKWGATVVSTASNEVVFDITMTDAATSPGFFDVDSLPPVTFNEVAYDQSTGLHTIDVTYSGFSANLVSNKITYSGGDVISNDGTVARYTVTRAELRGFFLDDIHERFEKDLGRNRWYIDPAAIDTAVSNGGAVTVSLAQLQASLKDSLLD